MAAESLGYSGLNHEQKLAFLHVRLPKKLMASSVSIEPVSYTHLRAHETLRYLV